MPSPFEMAMVIRRDLRETTGGRQGLRRGHAGIDQPHPGGRRTVHRFAGRRHLDGGPRADQSGEANRASPSRQQAEFHLRAPQRRMARVCGDTQVAGKGKFETASEAGAVDDRHARPWLRREPREKGTARLAQLLDFLRRQGMQSFQAGHVGTGEK